MRTTANLFRPGTELLFSAADRLRTGDPKVSHQRRTFGYRLATAVSVSLLTFVWFSFHGSPGVEQIDYPSLIFEGFLALLPIAGLFQIADLRDTNKSSYWWMFAGLSALALSMATDTLDELAELPGYYNTAFEGIFQVAGFLLLLIGIRSWMRWNRSMQQQLEKLATTDPLTGVANRRRFLELLRYQAALSDRTGNALSLIMLDIDHFKQVNDSLGHDVGDRALVRIAKLVRRGIRKSDRFARIGGEEFVLMTPSSGVKEAQALAEKLREIIERSGDTQEPRLTASFGVAEYTHGESSSNLIKRADKALYRAKNSGRNRVVSSAAA